MYSQSDDHEVIANYGNLFFYEVSKYPNERNKSSYSNLVNTGLITFLNFPLLKKIKKIQIKYIECFNGGKILIYSY
jgi:hypothetical protein